MNESLVDTNPEGFEHLDLNIKYEYLYPDDGEENNSHDKLCNAEIVSAEDLLIHDPIKKEPSSFEHIELKTEKESLDSEDDGEEDRLALKSEDCFSEEDQEFLRKNANECEVDKFLDEYSSTSKNNLFSRSGVSRKQAKMLIMAHAKIPKNNAEETQKFWINISTELNEEGPSVKGKYAWRKWFQSYKNLLKKKLQNGGKPSALESMVKLPEYKAISEKQITMMINFLYERPNTYNGCNQFWENIAKLLNAEGPSVKSPKNWRECYKRFKGALRRKIRDGVPLTPLEKNCNLPRQRAISTVSKKQISIMLQFIAKEGTSSVYGQGCLDFWEKLATALNSQGPGIKTVDKWRKWFNNYRENLKKRIKNGAQPTPQETLIKLPRENKISVVNEKRIETLMSFGNLFDKNFSDKKIFEKFWESVTKAVNGIGPPFNSPCKWKMWFKRYMLTLKRRQERGDDLTELQKQYLVFQPCTSDLFLKTNFEKELKTKMQVSDKVSKKQISILADGIEQRPTKLEGPHIEKREFWDKMSNLLNAEGPCIRDADSWRKWFRGFKETLRRKIINQGMLSPLEERMQVLISKERKKENQALWKQSQEKTDKETI